MARRIKRGRSHYKRHQSLGYMRSIRIPVRKCIPWQDSSGYPTRWRIEVTLGDLCNNFEDVFHEFKVLHLTLRHYPANNVTVSGLYAGVLVDKVSAGFGTCWFKSISSMPGAKVQSPHIGMEFHWRPTDPDSRLWRSHRRGQKPYVICTLSFADNGDISHELGGVVVITGEIMVRGKYYNAQVTHALKNLEYEAGDHHPSMNTP